MVTQIINSILLLFYVLSCLNTIRHLFFFTNVIIRNNNKPIVEEDEEEIPDEKYILDNKTLLSLGLSISYIITGIITGIFIN